MKSGCFWQCHWSNRRMALAIAALPLLLSAAPSRAQYAAPATHPTSSQPMPRQGHITRGAARGAALGAVGGAITGDAGKGAAAGAAMGGLVGAFRRRDERRQQAAQQQANATSTMASQQMDYTRAMAACLEGRGYSVK